MWLWSRTSEFSVTTEETCTHFVEEEKTGRVGHWGTQQGIQHKTKHVATLISMAVLISGPPSCDGAREAQPPG